MKFRYSHYFAKIKDIYLELPDFSYFHSPSGRFRDNPKMVGRKRIKRKLYGLLTNSETKTGSYIITGFRGVGKTSIVNQVINQLQPRGVVFSQSLAVLATWLVVHLVRVSLDLPLEMLPILMFSLLILFWSNKLLDAIFSIFNFQYHKKRSKGQDRSRYWGGLKDLWFDRVKRILKRTFTKLFAFGVLDRRFYKMSYVSKILYFILYALGLESLLYLMEQTDLFTLDINIGFFAFLLSLMWLFSHLSRYMTDMLNSGNGELLRVETSKLVNLIKQYINHSQKVFVRLSFPQEAIGSKDVLKSLVQHMYKEYLNYKGFNIRLSKLLLFTIIVLLVSSLYHVSSVSDSVNELKQTSLFHKLFLSQNPDLPLESRQHIESMFTNDSIPASIESYKRHLLFNESRFSKRELEILNYTIGWDYYGYYFYRKVYEFLKPVSSLNIGIEKSTLLPSFPDITFYLFLGLAVLISRLIFNYGRPFGLITNSQVRKMLKELNERCQAEVGLDRSSTLNTTGFQGSRVSLLSVRRSKNLRYPLATARDIENDLIRIFDQLDRVPRIFAPPEFTFVLDELDKLDPNNGLPNEVADKSTSLLESDKARKKRDLVSNIMANMKVFFTTAKAKFIFIAGRDMYDASLADSSDRESYLGSIFHDIIYVSSLYKDPFDDHSNRTDKPVDITYWAERYVCQRLMPDRIDYEHNLKDYSKYLDKILRAAKTPEFLIQDQKRKVINVVSVFIHYLAFRSKGSPMNMVKLFEDFAEDFSHKRENVFNDTDKFIVSRDKNPQAFYLTFDFHAQYRTSLVAGIFRPLVIEAGIHMKKYSDKILVSTSYLLDHIYKFHEFGFSWRNLELLPEIIDINRAPLLRRHIEDILGFLSDSHVKRIENGFVNFKFHRKVVEEINFLSRNNDTESAIFNFTLDESHAIKRHYRERLDQLIKDYKPASNEYVKYPFSIGFLESVLGDLHFFDKEYDEAILYYSNASQSLKERDVDSFSLGETLVYTRTTLREALVYERMNTYEPALIRYSELCEIIRRNGKRLKLIGERDQREREFASKYSFSKNIQKSGDRLDFHFAKSMYENFSIMLLPILAKLVAIEKISKQGITLKDSKRADRDFHSVFNYVKKDEKYLLKVEYHLQKGNILFFKNGSLCRDYENAEGTPEVYGHEARPHRDFNAPYNAYEEYMTGMALIVKKFNYRFMKDTSLDDESLSNPMTGQEPKLEAIGVYKEFTEQINHRIRKEKKSFEFEKDLILNLINFLNFKKDHISKLNVTHNDWNLTARLLSALGDCLLTMCDEPRLTIFEPDQNGRIAFVSNVAFDPLQRRIVNALRSKDGLKSRTELAVICYGCSSICYNRANEVRNYAFQQKKILFTIKSFHRFFSSNDSSQLALLIKNELGKRIIEPLNKNRHYIIFPEHSKLSEFGITEVGVTPNVVGQLFKYYKFSYNTEVKLAILHWLDLYISDFKKTSFWNDLSKDRDDLGCFPLNAYSSVNDQMVRLFELRLKSRYNRKVLLNLFDLEQEVEGAYKAILIPSRDDKNDLYNSHMDQELFEMCNDPMKFSDKSNITDREYIQFLVFDSVSCELRNIESINLNNVSYIKGYHYLAGAYMSLAWWVEVYQRFFEDDDKKRCELKAFIGEHEVHYIDQPEYAYRQALTNYYECINMHSEGDTYHAGLTNMYFTEGDFNDDNQHFCAAIERWLINHKQLRRRIQFIKNKLDTGSMFQQSVASNHGSRDRCRKYLGRESKAMFERRKGRRYRSKR